jgi:hypothetical protein
MCQDATPDELESFYSKLNCPIEKDQVLTAKDTDGNEPFMLAAKFGKP